MFFLIPWCLLPYCGLSFLFLARGAQEGPTTCGTTATPRVGQGGFHEQNLRAENKKITIKIAGYWIDSPLFRLYILFLMFVFVFLLAKCLHMNFGKTWHQQEQAIACSRRQLLAVSRYLATSSLKINFCQHGQVSSKLPGDADQMVSPTAADGAMASIHCSLTWDCKWTSMLQVHCTTMAYLYTLTEQIPTNTKSTEIQSAVLSKIWKSKGWPWHNGSIPSPSGWQVLENRLGQANTWIQGWMIGISVIGIPPHMMVIPAMMYSYDYGVSKQVSKFVYDQMPRLTSSTWTPSHNFNMWHLCNFSWMQACTDWDGTVLPSERAPHTLIKRSFHLICNCRCWCIFGINRLI